MENFIEAMYIAFSLQNLVANFCGVALGITFGALPGLTAVMGVALLIPLTFGMPAPTAFAAVLGMYCGAIYGGSITAIAISTPGTAAAAATMLEAPHFSPRGESLKALQMVTIASFIGGIISCLFLATIAPRLAKVALTFSAPEYFALGVFGLTIVAMLSEKSLTKGAISALLGMLIAMIGMDPLSGNIRLAFDNYNLINGISLVPLLVGLYALSQVMLSLEDIFRGKSVKLSMSELSSRHLTWKELSANSVNLIRSSLIGTLIGIVPATGAGTASFVAYGEAKRFSKTPEMFGHGSLEGVAATEASNNATTGGALIPLLTLGVPGDMVTAVILGALMIQGITPGPLLFQEHGVLVYSIFVSLFLANVFMLVLGLGAVKMFARIALVPSGVLMPIVTTLCLIGGYALNNSFFEVLVMGFFGVVGYLMIKVSIPLAPLLLAIILSGIIENNFRRALEISNNDYMVFLTRPISAFVLVGSLTLFCISGYRIWRAEQAKVAQPPATSHTA